MKMKKVVGLIATILILGGCASAGNQSLKAESEVSVGEKLKEGQTTKQQVRAVFGSPSETNFTDSGLEIWKYMLVDVTSDAVNYIPVVNLFGSSASGTKKELVVMFDTDGIIKRYSMSESDHEIKSGVFND